MMMMRAKNIGRATCDAARFASPSVSEHRGWIVLILTGRRRKIDDPPGDGRCDRQRAAERARPYRQELQPLRCAIEFARCGVSVRLGLLELAFRADPVVLQVFLAREVPLRLGECGLVLEIVGLSRDEVRRVEREERGALLHGFPEPDEELHHAPG
jgi:hypothetical protein